MDRMLGLASGVLFGVLLLGAIPVEAQVDAPPRRVHVRSHLAGHGGAAIPFGSNGVLVGGGLSTGFELAFHPNHDLGIRGFATWLPYDSVAHRRWQSQASYQVVFVYRFHDDLVVEHLSPYLEIGVGIGGHDGCLNGDFCGGFGLGGVVAGGLELPLHRYVSLITGIQVITQLGLVNGVGLVLLPELTLGLRAG